MANGAAAAGAGAGAADHENIIKRQVDRSLREGPIRNWFHSQKETQFAFDSDLIRCCTTFIQPLFIYPMINHSGQVDRSLCDFFPRLIWFGIDSIRKKKLKSHLIRNWFNYQKKTQFAFDSELIKKLIQFAVDPDSKLIQFAEFFLTLCFEIF